LLIKEFKKMFQSYDHLQTEICTSEFNIYIYIYIYIRLKIVVRPKHVADNLNKIKNY
jgi:hypothetical protein